MKRGYPFRIANCDTYSRRCLRPRYDFFFFFFDKSSSTFHVQIKDNLVREQKYYKEVYYTLLLQIEL